MEGLKEQPVIGLVYILETFIKLINAICSYFLVLKYDSSDHVLPAFTYVTFQF